jgi:predicted Zn-dependent peptidase
MPATFKRHTLDNGLTIVGEIDPEAHTSACGFFVKTGARDEHPDVMGVSHFLEHMMFKGTERRSAEDVNREFDEIGAQYNAYTSSEITCFYASTLPEHFANAADILADILRPALRGDDFDTEKGVILEEIAMYRDNPFFVLYEHAIEHYYENHPLAHRVLGTSQTITELSRDQMQRYFDDRYAADNTTVALAGNIEFDNAIKQFEAACGSWRTSGATRSAERVTPHEHTLSLTSPKFDRAYMLMITPGPALSDERRYAASILGRILGDQDNSRLHWALIETGLAEEAAAAYDGRDGCGDFFVYASGDPDRADDIWNAVTKELDTLVESVTEDDLERIRNRMATAVTLAGERPGGRMQRLGRLWTYLNDYLPLEEELARINAVTRDDLRAVYEAFPFQPRTVARLTPEQ